MDFYKALFARKFGRCSGFYESQFGKALGGERWATVYGDIISIKNAQGDTKSLSVALEPIQDLHGYDKPWSGGAGVNKFGDYTVINSYMNSSGVLQPSPSDRTYIIKALPSTQYAYKFVRIPKAGASANDDYQIGEYYGDNRPEVGDVGTRIEAAGYVNNIGAGTFTTSASAKWIVIKLANIERTDSEATASTAQVEIGSSVSTSWTPYSNICPISGHTECVTERTGVNLFDKTTAVDGYIDDANGQLSGTAPYKSTDYIRVVGGNSYYIVSGQTSAMWGAWYDEDKNYISGVTSYANQVITAPSNASHVRLTIKSSTTGNVDTFAVNYPSTATDYEAFDGNTYTTTLRRTVYGGTIEQVGGQLTDKMEMVDMGDLTWGYDTAWGRLPTFWARFDMKSVAVGEVANMVCSQYATVSANALYAGADGSIANNGQYIRVTDTRFTDATAFASAVSGVQLCYELATPQTIQLTPQEVELLKGTNNLWSDGKIKMVYRRR